MNAQQQTLDLLRGHMDPDTAKKLLLDYLCYDQVGEHAYGEDGTGNYAEITWRDNDGDGYWWIEESVNGKIYKDDEWGGCEKAIGNLSDDIAFDMCKRLGLEPDYDEDDEDTQ
jgi:hypothetical protein